MDNLRLFEGLLVAKRYWKSVARFLCPYPSMSAVHLRSCYVYAWIVGVFTNQKVETCNWCLKMAFHEQDWIDWHVFSLIIEPRPPSVVMTSMKSCSSVSMASGTASDAAPWTTWTSESSPCSSEPLKDRVLGRECFWQKQCNIKQKFAEGL